MIVPVKRLAVAKSRLRGAVPGLAHEALVLAMALDSVTAALASPVVGRVVVVCSDREVAEAVRALGAEAVVDVPDAGLNPALAYAAAQLRGAGATASLPGVAALPADLPAIRRDDLTAALRAANDAAAVRTFVGDAAGTGTVLLAAPPGTRLEPCFGSGSAASHAASGAVALTGDWPSLRHDVDTAADLAAAGRLGLGPHTSTLLDAAILDGAMLGRPVAAPAVERCC